MAAIELQQVTKRYPDGRLAVDGLSLTVEDGEFVVLVGPSGCGKSTALRMVAGLEEISVGDVLIGGAVVNHVEPKERDVAMVFQSYALYPHMSVRGNIGFALRMAGRPHREIDHAVSAAAAMLGLERDLDRKPAQLSGGQRQRVAMGRALVRQPAAFLMDEPLSNLDAKLRVEMRAQLAQMQRTLGTTTIYVTHDQVEAMTLGHRVAVLRDGVLQQVGSPMEIYGSPANVFVASFIGSPAMNLFEGTIAGEAIVTPLGSLPLGDVLRARLAEEPPAREVVVGIRPEDLLEAASEIPAGHVAVEVSVEVVEHVGSDVYLHFPNHAPAHAEGLPRHDAVEDEQGTAWSSTRVQGVARVSAKTRIAVGDRARLAIDPSCVHLFDAATGRSLTGAATQPVAS